MVWGKHYAGSTRVSASEHSCYEARTYIFMFMSSLGPSSLAVTFSEGFCFQQHRLSSYGVSCKLEVRKKIATSCKINSQIQLTLVGAAAKSSS